MSRASCSLAACAVAALAIGCGGDESPSDRSALAQAEQEADRQERRQARAEARLEAAKDQADDQIPSAANADGLAEGFDTYTATTAGWSADVPSGAGWTDAIESEPTPGRLFRTEFRGPGGASLIVDSTPFEAPTFGGAPADSRTTVTHPEFGTVEKIVFQGNTDIDVCQSGPCVDYLVRSGDGGYAVLAGGYEDFSAVEAVAERVVMSLRYYDY